MFFLHLVYYIPNCIITQPMSTQPAGAFSPWYIWTFILGAQWLLEECLLTVTSLEPAPILLSLPLFSVQVIFANTLAVIGLHPPVGLNVCLGKLSS